MTDRLAPPISTGVPIYCPHTGCTWSFDRVGKRGEGFLDVHLRVIHKGQPDPRNAPALVAPPQPRPRLVPIEGGQRGAQPQTPMQQTPRTGEAAAEAPVEPVGETAVAPTVADRERERKAKYKVPCTDCGDPVFPGSKRCTKCHAAIRTVWTREAIIDAIQRFAAVNGRPPGAMEWKAVDRANRYPAFSNCYGKRRPFAKWADAIEAAGFPRPKTGVRRAALSRREPQGRETPATPGASPVAGTDGNQPATVTSDSPGPTVTAAEPGSRPENAAALIARVLRLVADLLEAETAA